MAKELYVGHLAEEVTEEDLRRLFSVMGTVTSVHLIIDPETREFKRCGYVRMAADVDPAEVAETLDGAFLVDRLITVSIARPQKQDKPGKPGKPGGARRPSLGGRAKTGTGAKAGARPKPAADAKSGAEARLRVGAPSGTPTRPGAGARPGNDGRSGRPSRPGGERKGPRKRR